MSEFTVGDLIAVQTENRPEFNSRVWEVQEIVETASASASASASRRLILVSADGEEVQYIVPGTPCRVMFVSADGLRVDHGSLKRISVAEDRCTFLAVVPLETPATQTPSQSSTDRESSIYMITNAIR